MEQESCSLKPRLRSGLFGIHSRSCRWNHNVLNILEEHIHVQKRQYEMRLPVPSIVEIFSQALVYNTFWSSSVFLWWLFFLSSVYCISTHRFSDVTTMEYHGFPKQSIVVWFPLLKLGSTTRFSGHTIWLKVNMISYTFSFLPKMFVCDRVLSLPSYTFLTCSDHCLNSALKNSE